MSCCAPGAEAAAELGGPPSRDEILLASHDLADGLRQTDLSVPGVHCAGCIAAIEGAFRRVPGVEQARVNLSARRLSVKWRGEMPPPIFETVMTAGYAAHLFDNEDAAVDPELSRLLRATAVAGFASMNIMLLSVSVWSGAEPQTRQAFHWISAVLAFPALIYSGRVFFAAAWSALRQGRTNMEVPISVGVILAFALSLYDTAAGGAYAYFDAAISLLFFLLIGRSLDHVMREKARSAVRGLIRLTPRGATVEREDGTRDYLPAGQIKEGMLLAVAPGERLLVDGIVHGGRSDVDCSLVSGESAAQSVGPGSSLRAGTLNLSGALTLTATSDAGNSSLAEMVALMEAADGGRSRYRRIADRAARLYSPVVHLTALFTFLGWMVATGDWHGAISVAIAVLIITCPCALGLAVPIVHTVAARRLFEAGIMVKDGSALERLAEIDTVLFDKTGTLTTGRLSLANASQIEPSALAIAGAIAARSNHPVSRALAAFDDGLQTMPVAIAEHPGLGVECRIGRHLYRLGRAEWAVSGATAATMLSRDGHPLASLLFEDSLRQDAARSIEALKRDGFAVAILSGDQERTVLRVGGQLGIGDVSARLLPAEKVARIAALAATGRKVMMVGDGLNDAPALSAAHVSMAPSSAGDIGRNAADLVFLRPSLLAIPDAIGIARQAARLVHQNFVLAIGYNAIAIPFAIAGQVTPLLAALAMSASSILVVANALRLRGIAGRDVASGWVADQMPKPLPPVVGRA
ncbi:heavy metal translocating P-type ATPase [Mesorhizobium sp. M4B.F.Ca.ET.017.02.2.1]|uniref:heavy metal translocating P-type ATPase n=1 Tax=Mesorhizobium sp. M4B.F.Ca.ET.017.02.2.1 TaxID=2496649 RepID=UPI000FCB2392|nr:heavy metal translocating P-type ATPase [Mesorhizobium sp. M4B.F.Ca.ET.017.02.2.1]RVD27570.1 cadmium-translocating P-type ATPase [Mesorhizobium sp. M4B.F.Ca.ET.017.02.2.1]